jgi:hypothetical protein
MYPDTTLAIVDEGLSKDLLQKWKGETYTLITAGLGLHLYQILEAAYSTRDRDHEESTSRGYLSDLTSTINPAVLSLRGGRISSPSLQPAAASIKPIVLVSTPSDIDRLCFACPWQRV